MRAVIVQVIAGEIGEGGDSESARHPPAPDRARARTLPWRHRAHPCRTQPAPAWRCTVTTSGGRVRRDFGERSRCGPSRWYRCRLRCSAAQLLQSDCASRYAHVVLPLVPVIPMMRICEDGQLKNRSAIRPNQFTQFRNGRDRTTARRQFRRPAGHGRPPPPVPTAPRSHRAPPRRLRTSKPCERRYRAAQRTDCRARTARLSKVKSKTRASFAGNWRDAIRVATSTTRWRRRRSLGVGLH